MVLTGKILPRNADTLTSSVKSVNWIPKVVNPKSLDGRNLGLGLRCTTTQDASTRTNKLFDANTGK
jgi:hypothetical protein